MGVNVKRLLIKLLVLLFIFIWISINYKIIATIYCNYFCEAKKMDVEEGEVDYESMSPEELQKAFEKLQEERANNK